MFARAHLRVAFWSALAMAVTTMSALPRRVG